MPSSSAPSILGPRICQTAPRGVAAIENLLDVAVHALLTGLAAGSRRDGSGPRRRQAAVARLRPSRDLATARARLESLEASRLELLDQVAAGQLLRIADVRLGWERRVAAVRARLLILPIGCADRVHRVATLGTATEVEHVLAEVVQDVASELAEGRNR